MHNESLLNASIDSYCFTNLFYTDKLEGHLTASSSLNGNVSCVTDPTKHTLCDLIQGFRGLTSVGT